MESNEHKKMLREIPKQGKKRIYKKNKVKQDGSYW